MMISSASLVRSGVLACSFVTTFNLLAGCATSPTTEQVSTFGKAAATIASAYQTAGDTEAELLRATALDRSTIAYIDNRNEPPNLPAPKGRNPYQGFAKQAAFAKALVEYSENLAKATDPAALTGIESSAKTLVEAQGKFVKEVSVGTAPAQVPAVLDLASSVGVSVAKYQISQDIRRVIAATEPAVVLGTGRLIADLGQDEIRLRRAYDGWRLERTALLVKLRADDPPAIALRDFYAASDAAARSYEERLKVFDDMGKQLVALITAHRALLSSQTDINEALAEIQKYATQIKSIEEAG